MEPVHTETKTVARMRGKQSASRSKRAANSRVLALLPTIRTLIASGFISHRSLADELNQRRIPTARGGRWHYTTVVRMLQRLDLLMSGQGRIDNGLTRRRLADVRAEALGPTIRRLRKAGFTSTKAIAHKLNERGIPAPRCGKWHLTTVTRLLQRLKRLDRASNRRHQS